MSKLKNETAEQDALIEYSSRFLYFYRNNKAAVWGAGIAVVAIIAGIIGYFVYTAHQDSEARELLSVAEEYYMQGELNFALYGHDDNLDPGFIQIAENYGRTRSGNLAQYYAAVVYYEFGEYEEALEFINRFDVPDGILGVGPISFRAAILSELDRHGEAAETFIEAAEWSVNESTTPYNLMEAAIAFEAAGSEDRALEILDRIEREYPDSPQVAEVQRMRGFLTGGN